MLGSRGQVKRTHAARPCAHASGYRATGSSSVSTDSQAAPDSLHVGFRYGGCQDEKKSLYGYILRCLMPVVHLATGA